MSNDVQPGQTLTVKATREDGTSFEFPVTAVWTAWWTWITTTTAAFCKPCFAK